MHKNYLLICINFCILCSLQLFCIDPKISIITSVYNGDQFIEGFLEDITRQTIFDQCELIMINANSPGNEEPVIQTYMNKYPNIIYKRLEQDPGLYGTWNIAITMSKGTYITNANLDDRLAPNCYEVHAQELDAHPEIMLVYSDRYYTLKANETFENHSGSKFPAYPQWRKDIMYECWPCNNPMWRKTMHHMYGYFDANYKYSGDWEMWLRAIEGGAQFKKIDGYFSLYYYNQQGLSTGEIYKGPKNKEDKYIRERYGYMWGKETYHEYYTLAHNLDKNSQDQHTWALALTYYLKAYELNPHRAEPLIRIAQHYYSAHDNVLTYLFASKACDISIPTDQDVEIDLYKHTRYDLVAISAWYIGEFEKGEEAARHVLNNYPDDERLKNNLQFYLDRKNC